MKEMVDNLVLELVEKKLVTDGIILHIGYANREQASSGGTMSIGGYTDSEKRLLEYFTDYYFKVVDKEKPIRKITVGLNNVVFEEYAMFDLFSDTKKQVKEKQLLRTVVDIKKKYGKNSLLRGISYTEKATGRERNKMVGGHAGGEDEYE